ncbi:MAG: hypothetical protein JOY90_19120, partial [Bradyrhizobium sp.]|nr:hypothetical protein [Bradyrhizobium sp.]
MIEVLKGYNMSTKKSDLETMSFDELWSLHEEVTQLLSVRITAEKRELERRLAVLNRGIEPTGGKDQENARSFNANGKARRAYPRV